MPPAIFQVDLGDGPFYKSSVITARPLGWADPDNDEPRYRFEWNVNGEPVSTATGPSFYPAALKKGDRVSCRVTPVDEFSKGAPVLSNVVVMSGSLPQVAFVSIGGGPYYKGDSISVQTQATDDDGDPIKLRYAWYVNGEIVSGADGPTLSGDALKRGDRVMARVIPVETQAAASGVEAAADTAGELPGVPADSNVVTIMNTPPSSPGIVVGPTELSTAGAVMWASVVTDSVDADGDPVHYVYDWYKNGELQEFPVDTTSVPGAYVDGGDRWVVAVSASDNYDMGWAALASGPLVLLAAGEKLGGAYHTCMRMATPTLVRCWGRNNFMQLGDGTITDRVFPITLAPGGTVNVNRIALGDYHTCVLLSGGTVRCWGRNDYGQLGRNSTTSPLGDTSTNVTGLAGVVTELVAGSGHTCALNSVGAVYCWGQNDQGQVGDNTQINKLTAVAVIASGISAISAGGERTCAITTTGGLKCWGRDNYGSVNVLTPTDVVTSGFNPSAGSVSVAGSWVCGKDAAKTVKCFGAGFGATPVVVAGAVGGTGTVTSSGTALSFTNAQSFVVGTIIEVSGQKKTIASGSGTLWFTSTAFSPAANGSQFDYYVDAKAESLVSGLSHTCMVASTSFALQCFGNNAQSQLGNGVLSNLTSAEFTTVVGFSSGAVAAGAGVNHTCGIKGSSGSSGGVLFCWGDNTYGQLGNGSVGQKEPYPTGVGGWAVAIDGGNFNSCVVTETANVKCWGDNTYGQIGDGTVIQRRTPVTVTDFDVVGNPPLANVVAIAVGGYHACALQSSGVAKCWGLNGNGQLGTGNTTTYNRAKAVVGGNVFAMITAGYAHTCGIRTDGGVRCWGRNTWGGVGDATIVDKTSPTTVTLSGGGSAMSIAAGTGHTCAVKTDGTAQCWGANWSGQLGNNSRITSLAPVVVGAFTDAVRIATHDAHTCLQTRSRNTYCWGKNAGGQLGLGNQTEYITPQLVASLNGISESIAVGYDHTCMMTVTGGMRCAGRNKDGELGLGDAAIRTLFNTVSTLGAGVIAIAAGGSHTCAIVNGGLVKCWGRNEVGEIGNNTSVASATVPRVNPVTPSGQGALVTALGAGQNHTCDLQSGTGYCWGQGAEGQLGNALSSNQYLPVAVAGGIVTFNSIRGGARSTCATLTDGTVRCWGTGNEIGTWNGASCPNGNSPLAPVMTQGGPNTWAALSGNFQHYCARNTSNNGLICWGNNPFGQLGLNNTADQCYPQTAWNMSGNNETLRSGYVAIRGGDEHTCVMRDFTGANPGLERCWGRGSEGQLGTNGTGDAYTPVFANAWNGVAIGSGGYHSCMVTAGAPWVYCWGYNYFGQVGNNTVNNQLLPAGTTGGQMTVQPTQVEGGYGHSCAVSNGNLYCWGWDNEYQVGLAKGANNCVPAAATCTTLWTGGCGCGVPGGYTCIATCANATQCQQNTDQWGCTSCKQCTLSYTCYPNSQYCALQPTLVLTGLVTAVSTRDATTCAIQGGVAKCVGRNSDGQVGNGLNLTSPIGPVFSNIVGLTGTALLIASGGRMTCVKDSASGAVGASPIKCVGANNAGQLGRNTSGASTFSPAQVLDQSLPNNGLYVSQLVAGDNHVCALIGAGGVNSGWVYCWGDNSQGQMGRGGVGGSQLRPWPVLDPYGPTVGGDDPGGTGYKVLDGVVSIGAGRNHVCAYRDTGELYCWGYNSRGQLGNGGTGSQAWGQTPGFESTVPAANTRGYHAEVLANASSVAAGGTHTCFIMKNGRVRCMGDNDVGQLGTGEPFDYIVPRNVNATLLNNAVAIAAGYRHTCAIQSGGSVYCWGENMEGQLGLGDRTNRAVPTLVPIAPDTATAIYAGYSHTCIITAGGKAKCWGRNAESQISNGVGIPPDLRLSPVYLQNAGVDIVGINEMALGFGHTCYRVGAAASCVGYNGYGQIGDTNGVTQQRTPEDTSGNGSWTFTQVSVGDIHSCGVAAAAAYCWGNNDHGQLGDTTHNTRGRPSQVVGLTTLVAEVYAGAQHSCARKTDGSVWCWGNNDYGQIGRTGSFYDAPVPVALAETAIGLAVGAFHNCAVLTSGKMQCWGTNYTGQVGAGTGQMNKVIFSPAYVMTDSAGTVQLTGISSAAAGGYHTCAVAVGAKLYCWGSNFAGQLGLDNADVGLNYGYARFVKASSGGVDITAIGSVTAGEGHTCARKTDATVWCWGSDLEGQIGDDATYGGNVLSPTVVLSLLNVVDVSAGKNHTCAVRTTGEVRCWGANTDYQLGDGSTAVRQPTTVGVISLGTGITNKVLKVSSGAMSTCALNSVNNLRCWGDDTYGQVGVWGPRAVMQY